MKWKYLFSIVALLIIASVAGAQGDGAGAEIPTVTGIASDDGIELPSEVPAGLVTFTFENNRSDAPFSPIIARLNDGVTMDDLMAAMGGEDQMAAVTLLTLYGGSAIASGESLNFTTELTAGEYVLVEMEGEGFLAFTVSEGDALEMTEPEADVHLAMVDFGFGLPAFVPAGPQVWHLENIGDQWHEVRIYPAPEGISSVADVRAAIAAGEEEEPEQAFFWTPMGAGTQVWVTIDLEPGTYVLVCLLPDLAGDFSPHMEHGMIQVFTVE